MTSASCLSYIYVSIFTMTTTLIMNVVYFFTSCFLFFFSFRSFFLLQPFLPASSVWLQVKTESGDVTLSIAFCHVFSSVLSCLLSLFVCFLLSGSLFYSLFYLLICVSTPPHCVCLAGFWEMDLISFRNLQLQHSHKINCRPLITHTNSTISTLHILWWKVFFNVLHFTVRNYLLKQHHFLSRQYL